MKNFYLLDNLYLSQSIVENGWWGGMHPSHPPLDPPCYQIQFFCLKFLEIIDKQKVFISRSVILDGR